MNEDLAENYSIRKWLNSLMNPKGIRTALVYSLSIFSFIFLIEYLFILGDQRVVLEEVKISHQSNYEALHQKVSVVENPYGKPVLIIEKRMNIMASFMKAFLMSLFGCLYLVTRKTETHEPVGVDND